MMGRKQTTIDRDKLRRDPAYFCERLLRYPLHNFQKDVLRDPHPTVVHVAGRGAGKTVEAAALAAWFLFTKRRSIVVYVSARERQAKIARDTLLGMLAGTELADSIADSSYERLELSTGSRAYFLPGASEVAVRGLHNQFVREGEQPTDILLILDESASIPRATYTASMGILSTAPEGRRKKLIMGSPLGTNSWFYDKYLSGLNNAEDFTASHHTNAEHVPHVSKHYLREMKDKLDPLEYRAEILAEFVSELNSFFGDAVDGAIGHLQTPLAFIPGSQYHLGLDLSTSARKGSDFTVLIVIERQWGPSPYTRVADIRRFQHIDSFGLQAQIRELKIKYPPLSSLTTETYEATQLDLICTGDERQPFFPLPLPHQRMLPDSVRKFRPQ